MKDPVTLTIERRDLRTAVEAMAMLEAFTQHGVMKPSVFSEDRKAVLDILLKALHGEE